MFRPIRFGFGQGLLIRRSGVLAALVLAILDDRLDFLLLAVAMLLYYSPRIVAWSVSQRNGGAEQFPVTVDPKSKTITQNQEVDAFLAEKHSLLGAAIADIKDSLWSVFTAIAVDISNAKWYQSTASANIQLITITPGMRKEQIAAVFGDALDWTAKERQSFTTPPIGAQLPLTEGSFMPGIYSVSPGMTPQEVQSVVNERFSDEILAHYGSGTQSVVPLSDALTIASLIQRETITKDGMRLISGIMWNRIFAGMNLQIDSSLQYAKASKSSRGGWWPDVSPADKYIPSPYNTYENAGLPPAPIANPSVEAILAALNPIETPCIFYFNDRTGTFHCSATYAEHVALIKKYYGN